MLESLITPRDISAIFGCRTTSDAFKQTAGFAANIWNKISWKYRKWLANDTVNFHTLAETNLTHLDKKWLPHRIWHVNVTHNCTQWIPVTTTQWRSTSSYVHICCGFVSFPSLLPLSFLPSLLLYPVLPSLLNPEWRKLPQWVWPAGPVRAQPLNAFLCILSMKSNISICSSYC